MIPMTAPHELLIPIQVWRNWHLCARVQKSALGVQSRFGTILAEMCFGFLPLNNPIFLQKMGPSGSENGSKIVSPPNFVNRAIKLLGKIWTDNSFSSEIKPVIFEFAVQPISPLKFGFCWRAFKNPSNQLSQTVVISENTTGKASIFVNSFNNPKV